MKICFCLLIIFSIYTYPQVILKIADKSASPDGQVNLPISINNAGKIGAISLKISYDTTVVKFLTLENTVKDFSYNDTGGTIIISWFDITAIDPMNVNDTSILDLVFKYKAGVTQVRFLKEECEISDPSGNLLNVDYQDGSVTSVNGILNRNSGIKFSLEQNYPNPFNPSTSITYSLDEPGFIKLTIIDLTGKTTAILIDEYKTAGKYSVQFNNKNLSSGIYIYELHFGKYFIRKKMLLLK